jgi:hypothetical protein
MVPRRTLLDFAALKFAGLDRASRFS